MTYFTEKFSHFENSNGIFSKVRLTLFSAALFAALIILTDNAYAQRVQPMSYELEPSGSSATTSLRIENTSNIDMTLELTASRIDVNQDGKETLTLAEDDFLIFPPQLILKSGKTQAVRVKYIGEPTIRESAAYRISVKQIPIDLSGTGQSNIGMVVNFHTLAHVAPKTAEVDLHVSKISSASAGKWNLVIDNRGEKMGRLSQTIWTLTDGGKSKTLSAKEVADMTDKNLVMPGRTLNVKIPAVTGFNASTTDVQISAKS